MGHSEYWVVESVEPLSKRVHMEADAGGTALFARKMFPKVLREGMVFRFAKGRFIRDAKEEHKRLVEARAMLKALQSRDPGGDITT